MRLLYAIKVFTIIYMMDIQKQIEYWLESAKHDWETAETLFSSKRYDWSLFIAHLVLEKALKAHYVKNLHKIPPRTHMLHVLADEAQISLSEAQLDLLKKINEFNIEARYPDIKFSFYKLCTPEFAADYFTQIKDVYLWLLDAI